MARDLIVLAEDWGALPTSSQHLIRHLPGERRILWVNSVGMRRPHLTRHDMSRMAAKALAMLKRKPVAAPNLGAGAGQRDAQLPEGMQVLSPQAISWPGLNLAFKINQKLFGRQLKQKAAEMGLENPLLWISFPTGLIAIDAGLHDKVIYYCADDYGAIAGVDHEPALEMERELVKQADLILASSESLFDKFPAGKTKLLPHGVDFERFSTPVERADDLPKAEKIAGFYGSFLGRIDIPMLHRAISDLPDWEFVFIGRIEAQDQAKLALPNVTFLGNRPHDQLPGYTQHWSVSLLPFLDCDMVRAMDPLKLREYLAAGTPIASVEFPALAPYRPLVSVAKDRNLFSQAILQAAQNKKDSKQRQQSVSGEGWQARAQQAHEILEAL